MENRKNQVSEEEQVTISRQYIPNDLFVPIFSKLPVKAIARFRCVSKQCASILRRRDFTDLFLRISLTRLCLLFTFNLNGRWHFFSAPQDQNSSLLAPDRYMTFPGKVGSHKMSNPVCGLVCGMPRRPFICNPSTGQYIALPKVASTRLELRTYFGYDPIDKLFKVLRIHNDYRVLTLGTGKLSWRRIKCSIPHIALEDGMCINGILYYLAVGNQFENRFLLVSFDVRLETFKFMHVDHSLFIGSALINFKGKLGAVLPDSNRAIPVYHKLSTRLELWVLDDAENNIWSKHLYGMPSSWENLVGNNMLYVVGITGQDEIVFSPFIVRDPFYIFYYSLVRNTIARVEIQLGMEVPEGQIIHTFIDHVQDVKLMEELGS